MVKLLNLKVISSLIVGLFLLGSVVVQAKEATPMSADPEMEKVVNKISEELRCLVCQNQTIADSHAALAVDLKNQVRDMVKSGKDQDYIVDYMVERYGDFVRYRPPVKPETYLLWIGPFLLMIVGMVVLVINLKKRRKQIEDVPLSEEENKGLDDILNNNTSTKTATNEEGKV